MLIPIRTAETAKALSILNPIAFLLHWIPLGAVCCLRASRTQPFCLAMHLCSRVSACRTVGSDAHAYCAPQRMPTASLWMPDMLRCLLPTPNPALLGRASKNVCSLTLREITTGPPSNLQCPRHSRASFQAPDPVVAQATIQHPLLLLISRMPRGPLLPPSAIGLLP